MNNYEPILEVEKEILDNNNTIRTLKIEAGTKIGGKGKCFT